MNKEERKNVKEIIKTFIESTIDNDEIQVPPNYWNTTPETDEEFWNVYDFEESYEEIEQLFFDELTNYNLEIITEYCDPTIGYVGKGYRIKQKF